MTQWKPLQTKWTPTRTKSNETFFTQNLTLNFLHEIDQIEQITVKREDEREIERVGVTLPALPSRSAGLLGLWSMLPSQKRGKGMEEEKKGKEQKLFFQCFPFFLSLSLPPSLPRSFFLSLSLWYSFLLSFPFFLLPSYSTFFGATWRLK